MKQSIDVDWKGNMTFESLIGNHLVKVDASTEVGGDDSAPGPKRLLLMGLAGCTGMDVVSLMKKMRIEVENFRMTVESELTEEHPKHYVSMHLIYYFKGNDLPLDKLTKIVEMSQEKYCGVAATFRQGMPVTWEIKLE
jgi:putative redox protein